MAEEIEVDEERLIQLLGVINSSYGYDFNDYSSASLIRRIKRFFINYKIENYNELIFRIKNDAVFFNFFLENITVNVTELFRDASFFNYLKKEILPVLATYPTIRIWHAGCSTGEEVYSLAILLFEAGLLDKSILYGTDINKQVLDIASNGKYNLDNEAIFKENYIKMGGEGDFAQFYKIKNGQLIFSSDLKKRMVFSPHNLVIDQSFNEFNLIICRNVLIYFNKNLQEKVLNLFYHSLSPLGFLALGTKESIRFTTVASKFILGDKNQKVWQKMEL